MERDRFLSRVAASVLSARIPEPPEVPARLPEPDIDDLLAYAADGASCGLVIDDPAQDVCKTDAGIVPCVAEIPCPLGGGGTYFVNGFDFTKSVAAYNSVGQDLYLGFRTAGVIGDANGDGNAGNVCAIPGANIADGANIKVGTPLVKGAKVSATVESHGQGEKKVIVKFRRRKHYKRAGNHRQQFTLVKITGIA